MSAPDSPGPPGSDDSPAAESPAGSGVPPREENPPSVPDEFLEVLDYSSEPPPTGGTHITSFAHVHVTALNRARRWLAYGLLALVAVIMLIAELALVFGKITSPELRDLGTVLFTPILTLTGAAFGFFFGERRSS
jgi:hypothetical protein